MHFLHVAVGIRAIFHLMWVMIVHSDVYPMHFKCCIQQSYKALHVQLIHIQNCTHTHLCLTWAVPWSMWPWPVPLPPLHSHGFQQCLLKRVIVILTLCSVYFSLFTTPPLLHTFFLSLLLLLNLFFCSTRLSSLLLNVTDVFDHVLTPLLVLHLILPYFILLTLLFPYFLPFFPSFLPPNSLFASFSFSSPILALYNGWITAVYLALSSPLPVVFSHCPFICVTFLCCLSLKLHQPNFSSAPNSSLIVFLLHSLCLPTHSHFFFEPLTIFLPLLSLPFSPLWAPASPGRGSYPPRPFCETAALSSCLPPLAL